MLKNNRILKYEYIYVLFLCLITNDFFEFTSFLSFETPEFIHYKLYSFYLSLLYIPVIIYGVYLYFSKKIKMETKLFIFLYFIFIKDLILYMYYGNSYLFTNKSFELYVQFIVSFCMIIIIFTYKNSVKKAMKFFETFMCINIVTLVISIVTGIGTGLYGFEKRYHSANLTHGETGVLMGIFSIYLLCYKKEKYTNLYAMIIIVMVFATGSRKDLLYIIIVYSLYLIINMKKILTRKIKITSNQLMIYYCVFLIGVLFILLFGKSIATKLDLERMFSAITGIFGDGTSFIASDFSGKGRIDSIESWISLIKQNIFGVSFSFFDVQYNMQLNNYPTFPHSTMLFYYTVLGPLILVPLYLYIKTFINLIRIKSDYIYIFIYMFIYNFISGGALLNFKSIVINIFILWVGLKIIKERESRNYEGYNFSRRVWH